MKNGYKYLFFGKLDLNTFDKLVMNKGKNSNISSILTIDSK